jgi:hypothetical protein
MNSVKVVLSNGENDELELGTFNQGIVFDSIFVRDVASRYPIAYRGEDCWSTMIDESKCYQYLYVHGVTNET